MEGWEGGDGRGREGTGEDGRGREGTGGDGKGGVGRGVEGRGGGTILEGRGTILGEGRGGEGGGKLHGRYPDEGAGQYTVYS